MTIVLTGAAGVLGTILRPQLAKIASGFRSTDIVCVTPTLPNETFVAGDLRDMDFVTGLLRGASAVIHFGGFSQEDAIDGIFGTNIDGTFNVFEAARRCGVKVMVFASSVHVIGYYTADDRLHSSSIPKPDTLYGVSKAFGEALGSLYADKFGMDVVCLRIGSAEPVPLTRRHLSTWLSHGDLWRLVQASLNAEGTGFSIVYGVSKNSRSWWSNANCKISYEPIDNAEQYVDEIEAHVEQNELANRYQGGFDVLLDLGEKRADARVRLGQD
jgi:uronate dehydrogenase